MRALGDASRASPAGLRARHPGGHGKAPLGPAAVVHAADGTAQIEDYRGRRHCYPPA